MNHGHPTTHPPGTFADDWNAMENHLDEMNVCDGGHDCARSGCDSFSREAFANGSEFCGPCQRDLAAGAAPVYIVCPHCGDCDASLCDCRALVTNDA